MHVAIRTGQLAGSKFITFRPQGSSEALPIAISPSADMVIVKEEDSLMVYHMDPTSSQNDAVQVCHPEHHEGMIMTATAFRVPPAQGSDCSCDKA